MAGEFRPLVERGWKCHLVVERFPEEQSWLRDLAELGVVLHQEERPNGKYDLRAAFRAKRLCRKLAVDILVCENMHLPPLSGATVAGVPVRIWIKRAMNSCFEEGRAPGLKERLALTTRLSCALATRVIAVSRAVKEELRSLRIPEDKIWVRPNPRRLRARLEGNDRAKMRAILGFPESAVVIANIGHAVPVKGWDLLVQAFARIAEKQSMVRLLLIGSHVRPEEKEFFAFLESEVKRAGLGERILFVGHVENVAAYLQAADLFVMPSRSEGFSNALLEAIEAGLPCIATKVGIAEDVIQPGFNGFLVERNSVSQLAEAMTRLTSDDQLRGQMTKNAFLPKAIPTLEQYAEGLANDYESLLHSRH